MVCLVVNVCSCYELRGSVCRPYLWSSSHDVWPKNTVGYISTEPENPVCIMKNVIIFIHSGINYLSWLEESMTKCKPADEINIVITQRGACLAFVTRLVSVCGWVSHR